MWTLIRKRLGSGAIIIHSSNCFCVVVGRLHSGNKAGGTVRSGCFTISYSTAAATTCTVPLALYFTVWNCCTAAQKNTGHPLLHAVPHYLIACLSDASDHLGLEELAQSCACSTAELFLPIYCYSRSQVRKTGTSIEHERHREIRSIYNCIILRLLH